MQELSDLPIVGTGFTLGQRLDDNAAYERFFITYLANGVKVSGIMNIPKGDGPFPLLVFNHGYIDPAIYTNGRGLKREQDYMARQGFAVLHTDYRGHAQGDPNPDNRPHARPFGYVIDALAAVDVLRKSPIDRVDASKVGMLGHSLGGGVTLLAAVSHPAFLDAAVLYAPVSGDAWKNFDRWQSRDRAGELVIEEVGTDADNPAFWDSLSPDASYDRIGVPVRIFHGTSDKDVPYAWSEETLELLRDAGKDAELVTYPGEAHEFGPRWNDFMKQSAAFFRSALGS